MSGRPVWLGPDAPERLVAALAGRGFTVIAPRVEDGDLVLGEVGAAEPLPSGWYDESAPGRYRLARRSPDDPRAAERFGFAVGAHSWKPFLHPADTQLFEVSRAENGALRFTPAPQPDRELALFGVRPCDLAAIHVQDRVLMRSDTVDDVYAARREGAFLVAVECAHATETCFCASMGTGPGAQEGFDIALTELMQGDRHGFLARAGGARGEEVLAGLGGSEAGEGAVAQRESVLGACERSQTRAVDGRAARAALASGAELPMWRDVAERCLACGNCTLVCPTCFCTTVRDTTDLAGERAERWRSWDSCFGLAFSYVHGGSVRAGVATRYRHWLTHKLSSWHAQFGESGCVGCGRCIAWCPVGIDITAGASAAVLQSVERAEEAGRRGGVR